MQCTRCIVTMPCTQPSHIRAPSNLCVRLLRLPQSMEGDWQINACSSVVCATQCVHFTLLRPSQVQIWHSSASRKPVGSVPNRLFRRHMMCHTSYNMIDRIFFCSLGQTGSVFNATKKMNSPSSLWRTRPIVSRV